MNFKFNTEEKGQGLTEYALILVLVGMAVIAIMSLMGDTIKIAQAQVIGGMNDRNLDNGSMILDYNVISTETFSSGSCRTTVEDMRIISVNGNGRLLDTSSQTFATSGTPRFFVAERESKGIFVTSGEVSFYHECEEALSVVAAIILTGPTP